MEKTIPILQMNNVTKKIGAVTIIERISLELKRGEVFGFLGPNGAGKTTTIRMMVGLMKITDGEILINGHSVARDFENAISHVGGIIENPEMYKFLSGYDNLIHYGRMVPGIKKQRINEIVELVGLEKRIHEKVKTYSLGMRQRLGLAQALLHSPSLLILDEPTNGLDPAGIREIRAYIRKIAKEENITVFVSSHLLGEMQLMCDRIGVIHHGKLISVDSVNAMVESTSEKKVIFEVSPLVESLTAVKGNFPKREVQEQNGKLVFTINKKETAEITRFFVENGFDVTEIVREEKTLEEKFMEITGGDLS